MNCNVILLISGSVCESLSPRNKKIQLDGFFTRYDYIIGGILNKLVYEVDGYGAGGLVT